MARIRTVKPEFFRHEDLQQLESSHPRIMLFFAGLWCQCDKAGRFRWKPNQIKLDVLPFIEYNPNAYLDVLSSSGLVQSYEVEGEKYGIVLNFRKHQALFGSEVKAPERWPAPPGSTEELPRDFQVVTKDGGDRSKETGVLNGVQAPASTRFQKPSLNEVRAFILEKKYTVDPLKWLAHYEANGWRVGKNPMKNWKAAVVTWHTNEAGYAPPKKEKLLG